MLTRLLNRGGSCQCACATCRVPRVPPSLQKGHAQFYRLHLSRICYSNHRVSN